MIVMFDSVDLTQIPTDPQAVAGYTSGSWPTYPELVRRFDRSDTRVVSIAVSAEHDAEVLDVEPFDARNSDAVNWYRRQAAKNPVFWPAFYSDLDNMPSLLRVLAAAGISRSEYRVFTAHYTYKPHLCGPQCGLSATTADATQWSDHALGRNLDESLCAESFFAPRSTPKPPPVPKIDVHHYDRFSKGRYNYDGRILVERDIVERYDKLANHPTSVNREQRHLLRQDMVVLRRLIWHYASATKPISWNVEHRGWRWNQLWARTAP